MRKLATIQKIKTLTPIKGADAIEKATVLGWNLVVKKGEFKEGDLCVYFEVDSLLPIMKQFGFLASKGTKKIIIDNKEVEGYRLKTIRLRGQVSQGLALPLSSFLTELAIEAQTIDGSETKKYIVGDDMSEMLGVVKYEAPIPESMQGKMRGQFPSFIPKTDEIRLQNYPEILERYKDETFFVTEKLDGSSVTFFIKDDELRVCSRNTDLYDTPDSLLWRIAKGMDIEKKLRKMNVGGMSYALQGEIVGGKIQGNKLKIAEPKIFFFNIYIINAGGYVHSCGCVDMAKEFELPWVPIIKKNFKLLDSVDAMVEFATRKSLINPDVWVEGCVFRPLMEMQDEDLGRLSFKVINPEFLLKNNE